MCVYKGREEAKRELGFNLLIRVISEEEEVEEVEEKKKRESIRMWWSV